MNKTVKFALMAVIFVAVFFGVCSSTAYAYDNFTIETYLVTINVNDDNTMDVEEIIYADFEYESHGIYRKIPIRGFFSRT